MSRSPALSYIPSSDALAALIATAAVLLVITIIKGIHTRRFIFASLLASGLIFETVLYSGLLVLRNSPQSAAGVVAVLLGSSIGPLFVVGALCVSLPCIMSAREETWFIRGRKWLVEPADLARGLCALVTISGLLNIIGTVKGVQVMVSQSISFMVGTNANNEPRTFP